MANASPAQQWDTRYNTEVYQYGTAPNDFLAAQMRHLAPAGHVLMLAEGEGRNALHVLKSSKAHVTCVDLSKVGLDKARKLFEQNGIPESRYETVVADLAQFEIGQEAKWDAIVSIWCHVPEGVRKGLHERIVAGLKPGGVFILESYTIRQHVFPRLILIRNIVSNPCRP
jgi:cyclopropane fatty-acyl-phospholipid synthase-like methyltransferase